jgi:uncharacterized membrane protein YphA (DoxX/SURF4 family)
MMERVMQLLTTPLSLRILRLAIGVLLGWAALAKLGDMGGLATQVHNFRIVPIWSENLLAMTLPWIELLAALSLLLGIRPRAGAVVATGLLAVFTIAVAAALARGLDIECGCFGTADATRVGFGKLAQNIGMLAVAALGTLKEREGASSRHTAEGVALGRG